VLRLAGDGESFGELALFLGRRHLTTAEAIVDTILLHVTKAVVLREVDRSRGFARRVIEELCNQLRDRTLDLQSYRLHSGRQRVIGYLLGRLPAEINGAPAAVMLPAKKGIIASHLNLTHEHFSRILRELATVGLIEVIGRTVRIPDVHRLESQRNA
jgi:CRP-like cAMP-binding protein